MYDFQEPEDFDPRLSMHPRGFPWGFCAVLAGLFALGMILLWAGGAFAHEIPGMHDHTTYPPSCCNSAMDSPTGDCAPIDDQYVHQGVDGYEIDLPVGAHPKLVHHGYKGVVLYSSKDVKQPLDGRYHICLMSEGTYRYCFFPKPGTS